MGIESERNWVYFFESEDQLFNLFKCAEPHLDVFSARAILPL